MNIVKLTPHCPYCGKTFNLELEENTSEDDLIEECPLCGSPIDIRLALDANGKVIDAEVQRVDGDSDV